MNKISTATFPEGEVTYASVTIKYEGDNEPFDARIAIGFDYDDETASEELRAFDLGIFFYAADLDEFHAITTGGFTSDGWKVIN